MLNQKTTVQQMIRRIGLLAMMALSLAGCSATRVETTTGNWGTPVTCLLYTSPSPRDQRGSRMPSSA